MAKMLYLFTNTPEAYQDGRNEHFGLRGSFEKVNNYYYYCNHY